MNINDPLLQALLLLAIDKQLKGLFIIAPPGVGKSHFLRSYANLLPHPYLELPLNATMDRVLGSIDFTQALSRGKCVAIPGLLAQADGGTLYVDNIDLLDRQIALQIASALSQGEIQLEREGMSESFSTNFLLLASSDTTGKTSALLKDRVALFTTFATISCPDTRTEMMQQALAGKQLSSQERGKWQRLIAKARIRLPQVAVSATLRRQLILAALELGVEGNRADIFALRAARANAALSGRQTVTSADLAVAIKFVLLPRATNLPLTEPPQSTLEQQREPASEVSEFEPQPRDNNLSRRQPEREGVQDMVIAAMDSALAPELNVMAKFSPYGSSGKRGETTSYLRGRYISNLSYRPVNGKVALPATLLNAAIAQPARREKIDRTHATKMVIKKEDLRFKRCKDKAGMLFIFLVDASGSMALNRMHQAKGALLRLLQQSYVHRDKVALISFRGTRADVLLPPTQSVERAKNSLDTLPIGGGTPLGAGLCAALELVQQTPREEKVVLILFTDGRVNVAKERLSTTDRQTRQAQIEEELGSMAKALQREDVNVMVVDTESRFTSAGAAQTVAKLLMARYVYLPRADAAGIYKAASSIAREIRG